MSSFTDPRFCRPSYVSYLHSVEAQPGFVVGRDEEFVKSLGCSARDLFLDYNLGVHHDVYSLPLICDGVISRESQGPLPLSFVLASPENARAVVMVLGSASIAHFYGPLPLLDFVEAVRKDYYASLDGALEWDLYLPFHVGGPPFAKLGQLLGEHPDFVFTPPALEPSSPILSSGSLPHAASLPAATDALLPAAAPSATTSPIAAAISPPLTATPLTSSAPRQLASQAPKSAKYEDFEHMLTDPALSFCGPRRGAYFILDNLAACAVTFKRAEYLLLLSAQVRMIFQEIDTFSSPNPPLREIWDHVEYSSSEAMFMAAKNAWVYYVSKPPPNFYLRQMITSNLTALQVRGLSGHDAKLLGGAEKLPMGEQRLAVWESQIRVPVMKLCLEHKFRTSHTLHSFLMSTERARIEERTHDRFWGTGSKSSGGSGVNMLGRLLCEVRETLM